MALAAANTPLFAQTNSVQKTVANDPEILTDRRGAAGLIVLNRPRALHALTHAMVRDLRTQLEAWLDDRAVTRVLLTANGSRAFCAGGDVRVLYDLGRGGRETEALKFWRDEYELNTLIKRYPKPYVSLIDGIVMGGGVGLSVHGSHRVAGDRFQFAMPEVGIGIFPDVGGTWFLPRMPGELGTFCALTGERLDAADGVRAGVATHRVSSSRFPDLIDALCGNVSVDAILGAFAEAPGEGPTMRCRTAIDRLFAANSVEAIIAGLEREGASRSEDAAWANEVTALMGGKSPLSSKITLAQMRRGRDLSFEECMRTEFRMVSRVVYGHDFYEGVRAVLVDKDNRPKWNPSTLTEVSEQEVERHFAPLADDLVLA